MDFGVRGFGDCQGCTNDDTTVSPVLRPSTIPPTNRLLIRQGSAPDLDGIVRVCETHAEYWDGSLPSELRLSRYFERALQSQDDVFQFWVAENGQGQLVGWEMLSSVSTDPTDRQLNGQAMTCLGHPSASLARTLATHAIRHATRTPLQFLFACVPTRDTLMIEVLESVGYEEVGIIPAAVKAPACPERIEFVYVVEG